MKKIIISYVMIFAALAAGGCRTHRESNAERSAILSGSRLFTDRIDTFISDTLSAAIHLDIDSIHIGAMKPDSTSSAKHYSGIHADITLGRKLQRSDTCSTSISSTADFTAHEKDTRKTEQAAGTPFGIDFIALIIAFIGGYFTRKILAGCR